MKKYGTATFEEISEAFGVVMVIVDKIRSVPNPAARNMVKELIALYDPSVGNL